MKNRCLLSAAPPGEYVIEEIFLPPEQRGELRAYGLGRGKALRVCLCRSDGARGIDTGGRTLGLDGELCAGILLGRNNGEGRRIHIG